MSLTRPPLPTEPHHQILVLEVFTRICQDVQSLVELFINYDCDWDSIDLFSRVVGTLTGIATSPVGDDDGRYHQGGSRQGGHASAAGLTAASGE